jgi:hypothetical protein
MAGGLIRTWSRVMQALLMKVGPDINGVIFTILLGHLVVNCWSCVGLSIRKVELPAQPRPYWRTRGRESDLVS